MIGTTPYSPQRFFAVALLSLFAAACSSSGGGGPTDAAPVIISASFSGGGANPVAGDTLLLVLSEDITLTGSLLTDEDVTLSAGTTLGTVTVAPTAVGSNSLQVTLGAGVTIVPGTSTIALGAGNDVVRDASGQLGTAGTPVTIGTSDGVPPTITNITISAIDGELNGTGAAGGTLQVPSNGWTIDLTYSDNSSIATAQTQITANITVGAPGGARTPGNNLLSALTEVSANNTSASYLIPANVSFPNASLTLTVVIVDVSGLASTPATFSATVREFNDALQPFETSVNSSQVWYLDFARDLESYTANPITGGVDVVVNNGSNGTSDFEDLLRIVGLTSATPIANVVASDDSNTVVIDRIKSEILADLATLYASANVTFTLTQPSGSFGGNTSVPYASLGFSQISIAGASTTPGVLGLAIFDPSNTTQNDNTDTSFQSQRLGVFLHTIVDSGMGPPTSTAFRLAFDPFASSLGGTPIGDDGQDDDRLTDTLNDARATQIDTAIAELARFIAVVTAHECGHSVGLVENDPMPAGLYGNDSTNFPGSSDGHIRNTSLFPVGATNVMSPSLSYSSATNNGSAFNSLNLAYLREQVFYGN